MLKTHLNKKKEAKFFKNKIVFKFIKHKKKKFKKLKSFKIYLPKVNLIINKKSLKREGERKKIKGLL